MPSNTVIASRPDKRWEMKCISKWINKNKAIESSLSHLSHPLLPYWVVAVREHAHWPRTVIHAEDRKMIPHMHCQPAAYTPSPSRSLGSWASASLSSNVTGRRSHTGSVWVLHESLQDEAALSAGLPWASKAVREVDQFYLTTSRISTDRISVAASPGNTGLCRVCCMVASGAESRTACVRLIEWVAWRKGRTAELAPFTLDRQCALDLCVHTRGTTQVNCEQVAPLGRTFLQGVFIWQKGGSCCYCGKLSPRTPGIWGGTLGVFKGCVS